MIKTIISDFSYVVLFPVDQTYTGTLNGLYDNLLEIGNFDFLSYFTFNTELLDIYSRLRDDLYSVSVFTSGKIQTHPDAVKVTNFHFDSVISAMKYGYLKSDPKSYSLLLEELDIRPEEALFIDDSEMYASAAEEAGIQTLIYQDNETLIAELDGLLSRDSDYLDH